MSRWLSFALVAILCTFSSLALAGNVLTVGTINVGAGDKDVLLEISMLNTDHVAGFEFSMTLPEAMNLQGASTTLGAHSWGAMYIGSASIASNAIDNDGDGHHEATKTLAFIFKKDESTGKIATIPPGNGVIANLYFDIEDDADGQVHDLELSDATLSDNNGVALLVGTIGGTITIGVADVDEDGYDANEDCDDEDATVYPGATEVPYDGIDQDCSGEDLTDVDGDGYDAEVVGGNDCDDDDPDINPEAIDIAGDGIDQDCDGEDATPQDTDDPEDEDTDEPKDDPSGGCGCLTGVAVHPSGLFGLLIFATFIRRRR
jgi:hypothetical protein